MWSPDRLRIMIGDFFEVRRNPNRLFPRLVLWCTDRLRCALLRDPYVLVLARHNNEYLKKRKKKRSGVAPTVIEIRNDCDYNAGFCVQLQCVLAQLKHAETGGLQPVVNIDQDFSSYYDPSRGTNVWEYYFEPVGEISSGDLDNLPPEAITRYDPPLQMKLCNAQRSYPRAESPAIVEWYAQRVREGAGLTRKYVRVKAHVMANVDDFFHREMKGQPVIGVQLRGTDKGTDPNGRRYSLPDWLARVVPPEEYFPIVDEFLQSYPAAKIFVATDQQQFLETFRQRYQERVLAYGDTRSATNMNSQHKQDGRNYKKGEDVLIDCLLLARTHFLVRCQSNVGEVACYFNPGLPVINLQYNREFQNVDIRIRDDAHTRTQP